MNALKARRRYDAEQEALKWKKHQQEEQSKIDSMSPSEREIYLKEKRERTNKALSILAALHRFAGPYSNLRGKF